MSITKLYAGVEGDPLNSSGPQIKDSVNQLIEAHVSSIKALPTAANAQTGTVYKVIGFYDGVNDGGGDFVWLPSASKSLHNGITYYSPEAILAWDGTEGDLATLEDWVGAGTGVWIATSLRLTRDVDVRIPTHYATLQQAIDDIYSKIKPANGSIVNLIVESGHSPASGISVADGDYRWFTVSSEDSEIIAASGFGQSNAFISGLRAGMPTLNTIFNGNAGQAGHGYRALEGSTGKVNPACGAKNCWQDGIRSDSGSNVVAKSAIATGNAVNGTTSSNMHANGGATLVADDAIADDSNYYGVQASDGGILSFDGGSAQNASRYGIRSTNLGIINCRAANASGAGVHGIHAFSLGIIHAREAIANDCVQYGVTSSRQSQLYFEDGSATGCGLSGANCSGLSSLNIKGTNLRKTVGIDSPDDISINGGQVEINNLTLGGCANSENRYDSSGFLLNSEIATVSAPALNVNVDEWLVEQGSQYQYALPNATRTVRGLYAAKSGTSVTLVNRSDTNLIRLTHDDGAVSAEKRFNFKDAKAYTLLPKDSVTLTRMLDRWVVTGAYQEPNSYLVANLPTPSFVKAGRTVWVSDESGGACLAVCDQTNWRRVYDNAIVS